MANATRSVPYIPDLQGLGDVCSEVWDAWTAKQKNSNMCRTFHYLMFLEKTMRTAMLYIIHCMNLRSLEYTMWTDPWTVCLCQTLQGMTVPQFLVEFFNTIGTFEGMDGSEFFWSIPDRISEEDAYGFMSSKYMSSYPSFRVIRLLMRNMLQHHPTYLISESLGSFSELRRNERQVRMLPGLRGAYTGINQHLMERLMYMKFDLQPQKKDYNSKFYFQQGDEKYFTYIDRVFDCCAVNGMPSAKLSLPAVSLKGSSVPLLVYHPELNEVNAYLPTKYYATCDRMFNRSDRRSADLYRPTIKKEHSQLLHKDEEDDRYNLELLVSTTIAYDTYSFRHFNRTYVWKHFI